MSRLVSPIQNWQVGQLWRSGGSAPPSFVGALDDYTTNMAGAWSVGRRLLSDYEGAIIRVRRSSDGTQSDIGYDGGGLMDTTALLAFAGAGNAWVTTVYDQSGGSNHLTQATTANQPTIVSSGVLRQINTAPMCSRNESVLDGADAITGAFTLYMTGRNGGTPSGGLGSICSVGDPFTDFMAIFDDSSFGSGGSYHWGAYDLGSNPFDLVTIQTTWSALVINSTGAGGDTTRFRSNGNEVTIEVGSASSSTLRIGLDAGIHMEFAEAILYSGSHLSGTMGTIQAILNGWIAPALAALMVLTVDSAIAGQNPATASAVYSTADHGTETYVRNSGCWGSGFVEALTAISPYNTDGGIYKAGVLISPRHMLFATHYTPAISSVMHFVEADGTCITRTLLAAMAVTDVSTNYPDFTVGLLDSDVPAGIEFARVLPTNFLDSIVVSAFDHIPAMCVNLDEDLLVMDLSTLPSAKSPLQRIAFGAPTDSQRLAFHDDLVGGDSGSPLFWIIDGKMVILTVALTTISGAHVAPWHTEINAAMATLGGGYTLTDIDLSSYGTF